MEAIRFINNYEYYLDEIRSVVKPELVPNLDELSQIDLNDLFQTDPEFQSRGYMRGFVWSQFVKKALYNSNINKL